MYLAIVQAVVCSSCVEYEFSVMRIFVMSVLSEDGDSVEWSDYWHQAESLVKIVIALASNAVSRAKRSIGLDRRDCA